MILDLESLRRSSGLERPLARRRAGETLTRTAPRERFLRGPIPWSWLTAAGSLGGRALHVGLVIWHYTAMRHTDTIRINLATTAEEFGADRTTMSRGLGRLERAGLVTVARGDGRCHRVTLLRSTPTSSAATAGSE